ncbi:MAG: hypothetical protein ACOC1K_02505 [Nanoarchaeota archaeon]
MNKKKNLESKQIELIETVHQKKIELEKLNKELDSVSNEISKVSEYNDYSSFKFVHSNMPLIISKIAPKHKIPSPRDLNFSSTNNSSIKASIPWTEEDCNDQNPCNINVCPRCTLIHFRKVLDRLLADYYSK